MERRDLELADVILLLISPDFMNSDYINDVEVRSAMERHAAGTACVIPVILRPTNWNGAPFSKLQALPSDGRPITSWPNPDEAFLDVATGIELAISKLSLDGASVSETTITSRLSPLSHIEPQSAVGFVARKDRSGNDVIDFLREELAPGGSRVSALWGAGGVGKTALAAEAARSLVHNYQQRVVWISADGRDEFSLASLLDELSNQLGHSELRTLALEEKKRTVNELVVSSPTLVVLDNFETLNPIEQSLCLDWLTHISPSSVLITTRAKIDRPAVRNIPIKSMLPPEANEFLDRLLRQAQHRRTFEGINREQLIETAEANPLILQWVFGQIDLAQDWREVLKELAEGEGEAADRVFDRSFSLPLLNNGGRAALLALSLFVPSASRSALADVAGLSGEKNKKKFKEATKHLAALWLLRTTEDGTRLTVEGLTRDLAKTRLGSDQRSLAIRGRFVARFTTFAENNSKGTASDLNALETERENLLAAIDVAHATQDWQSAISIFIDIRSFLFIRGYWDDRLSRGEKLRDIALKLKDKHALNIASDSIASVLAARGEYAKAEQIYHEVLDAFTELRSEPNISTTLFNFGRLAFYRGDLDQAKEFYNQSLEIDRRLGIEGGVARTLDSLGSVAHTEGESAEARRLYGASLEIKKKLGDQRSIAISLHNRGVLDEDEGKIDQARQQYLESLEIEKKLRNQSGIANSLNVLGALAKEQGLLEEALRLLNQALEIEQKLGDQGGQAASLRKLGLISWKQGKTILARQQLTQSLEIERRLGNKLGVGFSLHELGTMDLEEGALESAELLLQQSFRGFQELKAKIYYAESIESLGKLKIAQGLLRDAREYFEEALNMAKAFGQKSRIAHIKHSMALLAEKENKWPLGRQLLSDALEIFDSLGFANAKKVKVDLQRLEKRLEEEPNAT